MREISNQEIMCVSGAGFFSDARNFVGNVVIDGVKVVNDVFNTSLFSSVGHIFDRIGLGGLHHYADSIGYSVSKFFASIGSLLGGDASRIDYHFEEEWGA